MSSKSLFNGVSAALLLGTSVAAMADYDNSSSQSESSDIGAEITDTTITAKVKAKYMTDNRIKGADISVNTANGVVTLTGSAPTSDAKSAEEEIAKNVEGVGSVNNDIQTPSIAGEIKENAKHAAEKTERVISDSWITTKVKSALLADSVTKGFKISVETVNQVVALSGTVDTQASADHIVGLVKQIEGVASVDADDLEVASIKTSNQN